MNEIHTSHSNWIFDRNCKSVLYYCKSSPKWKERGLWYEGEEPCGEELAYAYDNLRQCGYAVDYILTHKYEQMPPCGTVSKDLQNLTSFIEENVRYQHWYAGHWHTNKHVDEKHTLVYDVLIGMN